MKVSELMRRDVVTVDTRDDLALAQQVMLWNGVRHLPVLRDGQLVGVLTERDLLAARVRAGGQWGPSPPAVKEAMTADVEHVTPDTDLADAAGMMATGKLGCLPVLDAGVVVGMLTAIDVLASDAQCPVPPSRLPAAEVGAVMTRRLAAVHPDDRIVDAAALMQQRGARHLPVIDGEGHLIGMLSDRDVRTAIGNPLAALQGQGGGPV
ncbi:MAG: CBS domain-containing protein, partial [Polyangiales bacterium]